MGALVPDYARLSSDPSSELIAPQKRRLTHQQYTLAAIDDIIARGKRRDRAELRQAALADHSLFEKVLRVCQAHLADPCAQRYHFWKELGERHLA